MVNSVVLRLRGAVLMTLAVSSSACVRACIAPCHMSVPQTRVTPWPRPIPCRTSDSASPRVIVTTLGDVQTTLADGAFDPMGDRVRLGSGETVEHYYRDK